MLRKVKVVGYRKFTSKKGNVSVQLSVTYPREGNDADIELVGNTAETYFVPDHVAPRVSKDDVGKDLMIVDAYYNNRNNLIDIMR